MQDGNSIVSRDGDGAIKFGKLCSWISCWWQLTLLSVNILPIAEWGDEEIEKVAFQISVAYGAGKSWKLSLKNILR